MNLWGLQLKLIYDWKQAWRWSSMRFLAAGGVIQGSLLAFPTQLQQYLPPWLLSGLAEFALFCVIAGGIGRITRVETHDDGPHSGG